MKDPIMIQHQAYLSDLEKLAETTCKGTERVNPVASYRLNHRGGVIVAAFITFLAIVPWNSMLFWG
ncbi:hypothetical protein MGEO_20885 [Marivita geojedonensis]|uniref:Uncharacterized protein n=1 Tax=Marivita geojedonensis TaxID=1123756 RepID=A0A1X4N6Z9_9RHOB|nr:hypothetical protein MGEO_20885 [Marivita geojedonensis]PRY67838.1 hypothetical protein CLV76_1642 [Marivita geojedonensis]